MSDSDSRDLEAVAELETVVRRVTETVAEWRRRAHRAEAARQGLGEDHDAVAARERISALEEENADLKARLEAAGVRVAQLLDRLRFLEEQAALEESHG